MTMYISLDHFLTIKTAPTIWMYLCWFAPHLPNFWLDYLITCPRETRKCCDRSVEISTCCFILLVLPGRTSVFNVFNQISLCSFNCDVLRGVCLCALFCLRSSGHIGCEWISSRLSTTAAQIFLKALACHLLIYRMVIQAARTDEKLRDYAGIMNHFTTAAIVWGSEMTQTAGKMNSCVS